MKRIIILLLFAIVNNINPQTYNDFAPEIFFGRLPSAKSESMGRVLTLNYDPYFVSQSNPASLTSLTGISTFYSNSLPFYGLTNATYNFVGLSYVHTAYGGIAFNYLCFNFGSEIFGLPFQNPFIEKKYLYTLTYAYNIKNWFSIGLSANLYVDDFGMSKSYSDSFFELGLIRDFSLVQNSEVKDKITVGTQLKNIFNQSFSAIDEAQADVFPSIFRFGISNSIEFKDLEIFEKDYFIGFTLGFEYQDLLNSDKRTAYKVGGELALVNFIFLRSGYYSETPTISEGKLTDFTYGFGVKLDFEKYISNNFPLIILFDFVSLEQPNYGSAPINWENFTTFSLAANYNLD